MILQTSIDLSRNEYRLFKEFCEKHRDAPRRLMAKLTGTAQSATPDKPIEWKVINEVKVHVSKLALAKSLLCIGDTVNVTITLDLDDAVLRQHLRTADSFISLLDATVEPLGMFFRGMESSMNMMKAISGPVETHTVSTATRNEAEALYFYHDWREEAEK